MRIRTSLLLIPCTLAACSGGELGEAVSEGSDELIFGVDNRKEMFERDARRYDGDSVVNTFDQSEIVDLGGNNAELRPPTSYTTGSAFGTPDGPLCANERFRGQPTKKYCTGFLVAPNLVATAGHCICDANDVSGDVTGFRYVFRFEMENATQARTLVPWSDVYPAKRVVSCENRAGQDWAFVELTRSVPNHRIAPLRRFGSITNGTPLFMIGHPSGLPMKFVNGGTGRNAVNQNQNFFDHNLDESRGNSGGPVFNETTGEVEGIVLTIPDDDFAWDATASCYRSKLCPQAGCPGGLNGAQRIALPATLHVPGYSSTFFANVGGTAGADLISLTWNALWVRKATTFANFGNAEAFLNAPFNGNQGTFFADVDGDHLADAILVNENGIHVRRSNGTIFITSETWTSSAFRGDRGTFFADVNADGRADAIAVNWNGIQVRRAPTSGTGFLPSESWSTTLGFFGSRATFFADVNADGRADAVKVDDAMITVRLAPASGVGFLAPKFWSLAEFFGTRGTFMADVNGDHRADMIAVGEGGVTIRMAHQSLVFDQPRSGTTVPFFGTRGTMFADVNGDGRADAIKVDDTGVFVRLSTGSTFSSTQTQWVVFGPGMPTFGNVGVYASAL